jgi:hypothetical protein
MWLTSIGGVWVQINLRCVYLNKCSLINRNSCLTRNEMHIAYNVTSRRVQVFDFCALIIWSYCLVDWGYTFIAVWILYVCDRILLVLLESVIVFAGFNTCQRLLWWICRSYITSNLHPVLIFLDSCSTKFRIPWRHTY